MSDESILIVVPSYNNLTLKGKDSLDRCIKSIQDSISMFRKFNPAIPVKLSWVDDASTDNTYEYLQKSLSKLKVEYKLERLGVNSHQAYCRNHGSRAFPSKYIMFCDSDDEWFPNHIAQCYEAITSKDSHQRDIMLVSTQAFTAQDLQVHPDWAPRISGTIPFTKIVRRELFEFVEGFPTNDVFKLVGCEDQAFMSIVDRFFHLLYVNYPTVRYHNYPGSFFDRQLTKFRLHPYFQATTITDKDRENGKFHQLISQLVTEKIEYLKAKLVYTDLNVQFENFSVKFI